MTIAVPNSAFALNDDAWAIRFAEFYSDDFQLPYLSALNGRSPVYTTLPMPVALHTGLSGAQPAMAPTDGYYDLQWHFAYMGDIETIWEEYSGAGVHVGIYDDGLQTNHPDLEANYDPSLQVIVDGEIIDPLQSTLYGAPHGTAVAGLIAAANNGTGTVGVAWGASLTGVNIFSGAGDINNYYAGFLQAASQSSNFDVINHSWGKYPGFWQDGVSMGQDASLLACWFEALEIGRSGLGTIQVKAAGNQDQNANGDLSTTTRATIIVGAYDDDGDASYYSSYGANLLVSAPSSGASNFFIGRINAGLVTTDVTGNYQGTTLDYGYGGLPDPAYTNGFGGTSGATPIVTGVVALMLDANPNLGWRDVQNILAYSATEVGSGVGGVHRTDENHDWKYNAADNWNGGGLHFSEDYGFGGVNAFNAVRMAEVWHLFGGPKASANESSFEQKTTSAVELLDGKTTDIKFQFGGPNFHVEFVDISINISHTKLDDLEIYLISPDGTETTLIDFRFELQYNYTNDVELTFGANAFRGENGAGEWTIRIVDRWLEDGGTVNSASVTLHGTDDAAIAGSSVNDVYHYTDEVLQSLAREGGRFILTDTDGGTDWLDMSAMTGNLLLRMSQGWTSTVGGKSFLYMGNNTIENAVAGDGNDNITGTYFDNVIYGMRGNDTIRGGSGDDTISGGAGNDTLSGDDGSDRFLFDIALNAATNVDTILDFNLFPAEFGRDSIWLDSSVFTVFSGLVGSSMFHLGTSAADGDDYILYDLATGNLFYDADGSGTGAATLFANLANKTSDITFSDFKVVDTTGSAVVTGSGVDRDQPDAETTSTSTDTEGLFGTDAPINGTQYGDEILGKNGNDVINGLGGDDVLAGGGGNDIIDGGEGWDQIFGEDGDDTIYGGGSPGGMGDWIYGGAGNDVIYGSNQPNGVRWSFIPNGDQIIGEEGEDIIYGLDGDDGLDGGAGNDLLYGSNGNDVISGGLGDDHIYGGLGFNSIDGGDIDSANGFDTVHFDGNFADYVIVGKQPQRNFAYDGGALTFTRVNGLGAGEEEAHEIRMYTVEALQFADRYIDLTQTPLIIYKQAEAFERPVVNVTTHGFEKAVVVNNASDITITDDGGATGIDALNFVSVDGISGNVVINADSLGILTLNNLLSDAWSQQFGNGTPGFTGDVTVNAAAGERELYIYLLGARLDAGETVSDNTATSVVFNGDVEWLNGSGVNDFNLSFASAETIRFYQTSGFTIKWNIPNVTTIDFSPTFDGSVSIASNSGYTRIETPLDDSVLATAGGSVEFRFIGSLERDFIRLGNLGSESGGFDLSNDGTSGAEATSNAGLGLRGTITLDFGDDVVRILGSGAFQGGTIDAGYNGDENQQYYPDNDVIQMTFGVAGAIGGISAYISGFESLQLDVTSQSHTADVRNFDSLRSVIVAGTEGAAGVNTVLLLDGSRVEFKATNDATHFGTVNLMGSAGGINLVFSAPYERLTPVEGFIGGVTVPADEAATGIVHVADATIVNIFTNSRDDFHVVDLGGGRTGLEAMPPIDSFEQALVLDNATTVNVSGDTGWDFTVAGSDISKVTRINGSGVTGTGAVGAIVASAQTGAAVHFTGGAGDDVFAGGAGNDTLEGGTGNDTYIIDAGSSRDTLVETTTGGIDKLQSDSVNLDLNLYTNIENAKLTGSLDLGITGNGGANVLTGNAGNNLLDGGIGADTAVFSGNKADYSIVDNGDGTVTVTDLRASPEDGEDTLTNVEYLKFADGRISVDPNAPIDILLSNYSVTESSYEGLLVGTLSAVDDEDDAATFELVDDSGGRFQLVNGDEVRTVYHTLLDYEQQTTYDIKVKVTDGDGLTYEKTLTINLLDYNPEYMVGRNDIDTDDIIWGGAYNDFLAGNGGTDTIRGNGGSDTIIGGTGDDTAEYSGNIADYEITWTKDYSNAFTIRDKRSNPDGTGFDGVDYVTYDIYNLTTGAASTATEYLKFADGVINTWDLIAPTDVALSSSSVAEGAEANTVVGTLTTTDLSSFYGETFSYTLLDDAGGRFALDGDKISVAAGTSLDYETATTHDIRVKVTDGDGHTFEKTLTISVDDVTDENEPASVSLVNTRASIAENTSTAARIKVADIVVTDDGIGTNQLSLVGRDRAMFEIIGMALFLKAGVSLDASKMSTLDVAVAVDDAQIAGTPDATSATHKLKVADVAGVTMINGTSASQTLNGTSGNDWFDGKGGSDTFKGGKGDDSYVVDSSGDKVVESSGQGSDKVYASVSHTLSANVETLVLTGTGNINGTGNSSSNYMAGNAGNNTLSGGSGNDKIYGRDGNDVLDGGSGNDSLFGEAGHDTLKGGSGNDRLNGGLGRDYLYGGSGRDVFDFNSVAETAVGSLRDVIFDFRRGQDDIDLSTIDANASAAGNQAFSWIGTAAFSGKAGQLHIVDQGSQVLVQGDIDGDRKADFDILVKVGTLSASDFIL
jgi:Ca2+-binding RTX toxin-like protein